jgi:hypothetical protein
MVKLLKFDGSTSWAIIETTSWWQPQLKARTQPSIETSHEIAAAAKQLAHQDLVRLPEDFIQKEVAYAFVDGVKQCLLMDNVRSLSEALNQDLKLEAVKVAARPQLSMQEVKAEPSREDG